MKPLAHRRSQARTASLARAWHWPLALAAVSLFGLLSALLGQGGLWWVLSWIALGLPLAAVLRPMLRRAR